MQHHFHLNRSFDMQLSPVAASIIDWAPAGRTGTVGSSHTPACSLPAVGVNGSHTHAVDSMSLSDAAKLKPAENLSGMRVLHRCTRQLLANSCVLVPIFSRGTFNVNAGLLASLGLTGGWNDACSRPSGFHANDVLQLEATWGKRQWVGIFNLVCFSWMSTTLPLFEFITVSPRTDSSLQVDRLMFNWSGFWRVFVSGDGSRRNSLISMDSPAERFVADVPVAPTGKLPDESKLGGVTGVDKKHDRLSAAPPITSNGDGTRRGGAISSGKKVKVGNTSGNTTSMNGDSGSGTAGVCMKKREEVVEPVSGSSSELCAETQKVGRWWRIRELRCGVGVALKNDIVSAANAYFGYSFHLGRALTFSSHMDVLRRGCYSVTCSTDRFDLATRLRVNHITSHFTEMDAGIGWRPLRHAPGFACRLSYSMGRTSMGFTARDVTSHWGLAAHRTETPVQATAVLPPPLSSLPVPVAVESRGALLQLWDASVDWGLSAAHLVLGTLLPSLTGSAAAGRRVVKEGEEVEVPEHKPRQWNRLSRAFLAGVSYCRASVTQAKFDLTMGVATQQPRQSRPLRFFFVVSAY
ncbi:hypothetical protein, conserved [Trypanosoma brucei gambiense DAL972]|uniref:Uncharacterized protein n=1 Tax=Trypanosoma brucei gambiense (strain MHOM/CI/86/DAL972) TaxID=679716 RepID=C9ZVW9_TRYB9|nr:hypothetical protein, conserved [Trypanosoma brucei gambiense DAL972]CBH13557.1 hypothetical protein, conserved [Trypanosoma brucei gambiense DAL972]|eukprot:XP_011775834.1 hypothetical protein, conserved [Trypanosoma brucei gambiense DAL972]